MPVVPTPPATTPVLPSTPVVTTTAQPTAPPRSTPFAATTPAATTPESENWLLADRLCARLDKNWLTKRGVYGGTGNLSIRMNAMLLELHAIAARTGHIGPARQDARIAPLVRFFTTSPVLVRYTELKRTNGAFPHVPAFEGVFTRNTKHAVLHPSADGIVARALGAAWSARAASPLPPADEQRMKVVIHDVAHGTFYRRGDRAENQINWNTDVMAANFAINGDRSSLAAYRKQLVWFADHIVTKYSRSGSTNLSAGDSFRYSPQLAANEGANRSETVEYANLVHGALGFYGPARAAGMPALGRVRLARLERWSRHIVYGTWTHAGYLNWDTGLSTKRRHLRQYWGFALDALLRGSIQNGIVGSSSEPGYVQTIAKNGLDLFLRTAWDGTGPLPSATSFGAPNGFHDATQNAVMAPLRFAVIGAELAESTSVKARTPGNMFSDDTTVGRLALSTPAYNTAILRDAVDPEGGLEPTRLFDGRQRPLTQLASDAFQGPALGLRLSRGPHPLLDTQPGHATSLRAPFVTVSAQHRNTAGQFQAFSAGNTVRGRRSSVHVSHAFTIDTITTNYSIHRGKATVVELRVPVWGRGSTIAPLRGAEQHGTKISRIGDDALQFIATTQAGAQMGITFSGVPQAATINVVAMRPFPRAPAGVQQLEIRFRASAASHVTRRLVIRPGTTP